MAKRALKIVQESEDPVQKMLQLEYQLANIKLQEQELKQQYEDTKKEIFAIFDEQVGEETAARYRSPKTGKIIAREYRPNDPLDHPKIDYALLASLLTDDQLDNISTTVKEIDEEKLVQAIDDGKIDTAILDKVVSYPQRTSILQYKDPTKEEQSFSPRKGHLFTYGE